jgi:HNH endonuclease
MFVVKWLSGNSKGYDDHIPATWTKTEGLHAACEHPIVGPKGWLGIAHCSVTVSNENVIFDYEGKHRNTNTEQEIVVGKMKFVFSTRARRGIPDVLWKYPGKQQKYEPGLGKVELRDDLGTDNLNYTEGDRRLSFHFDRERRAIRGEKIRDELSKGNKLRCEVCKTDLIAQYGAAGLAAYEVHHRLPLNKGKRITYLKDLAILCANCHRAIHLHEPMPSVADFAEAYGRQ